MPSVGVNPPKTPVTEGSGDKAIATVPNVCKMPGPPAPFVPTPLPNIGQSSDNLDECTTTVLFEGKKVAIKGTTYKSKLSGDMASKATGGGVVSSTEEGTTSFVAPGSMNVKAEGKNIQLLGDAMLNNGGSTPSNSATPTGNIQAPNPGMDLLNKFANECENSVPAKDADGNKKRCTTLGTEKHACCEKKIQDHKPPPKLEGEQGYKRPTQAERTMRNPPKPTAIEGTRQGLFSSAVQSAIAEKTDVGKSIGQALGGKCFPDAAIINPDDSKTMVDFKFPCPKGHPSGEYTSKGNVTTQMSKEQQASYDALSRGTGNGTAECIVPSQLSFGF
jgi:uncharacterized Zn-binding protein involved in type VI secretion